MTESRAKAEATRKANAEARKAEDAKRWAQEQEDRELVLAVMRGVLKDPEATTAQKLYAVSALAYMTGQSFVAYNVPYPGNPESNAKLVEQFKAELGKAAGD